MIPIPKHIFWNFFDFVVLCSLIILSAFLINTRNELRDVKQDVSDTKFQMRALHQDMFQLENFFFQKQRDILQKQRIIEEKMAEIEKDNRPEIHVHGNKEGSVKLYNVSGEIVIETLNGFKELEFRK